MQGTARSFFFPPNSFPRVFFRALEASPLSPLPSFHHPVCMDEEEERKHSLWDHQHKLSVTTFPTAATASSAGKAVEICCFGRDEIDKVEGEQGMYQGELGHAAVMMKVLFSPHVSHYSH